MSNEVVKALEGKLKQANDSKVKEAIEKKIESIKKGSVTK